MSEVFPIDKFNITLVGKEINGQVILQFDEDDGVRLHPGTQSVVDEIDGSICVMDLISFRAHILRGMALLASVDPLFRELLDCEPDDADCAAADSLPKEPDCS